MASQPTLRDTDDAADLFSPSLFINERCGMQPCLLLPLQPTHTCQTLSTRAATSSRTFTLDCAACVCCARRQPPVRAFHQAHHTQCPCCHATDSLCCLAADYDLTGQVLWPAAHLLAAFVDAREGYLAKCAGACELGAGLGLVGLLAAQVRAQPVLRTRPHLALRLWRILRT
jgi:hypothetical protein